MTDHSADADRDDTNLGNEDDQEEEDTSRTEDIEGFVWLIDEGEGYFLTGNEAFREELDAAMSDAVADFGDDFSNSWFKRKRGLWFIAGVLAFEHEDDSSPGWDIVASEPTAENLRKYHDQLTRTVH